MPLKPVVKHVRNLFYVEIKYKQSPKNSINEYFLREENFVHHFFFFSLILHQADVSSRSSLRRTQLLAVSCSARLKLLLLDISAEVCVILTREEQPTTLKCHVHTCMCASRVRGHHSRSPVSLSSCPMNLTFTHQTTPYPLTQHSEISSLLSPTYWPKKNNDNQHWN